MPKNLGVIKVLHTSIRSKDGVKCKICNSKSSRRNVINFNHRINICIEIMIMAENIVIVSLRKRCATNSTAQDPITTKKNIHIPVIPSSPPMHRTKLSDMFRFFMSEKETQKLFPLCVDVRKRSSLLRIVKNHGQVQCRPRHDRVNSP